MNRNRISSKTGDNVPAVAVKSAQAWLAALDSSGYSRAWEESAASMHSCISRADFEKSMQSRRDPLGRMKSREIKIRRHLRGVPWSGKDTAVISYITTFEKKTDVPESIVLALDPDGKWRVEGYTLP
jgi:hypothetical protein